MPSLYLGRALALSCLLALPAAAQSIWTPAGRAPTDYAPQMAFDAVQRGLLLFGPGPSLGQPIETWLLRGGTWTQLGPAASPGGRAHHALATDWRRGRVVLFGGLLPVLAPNAISDETWEWDGATWRQVLPATVPAPRSGHAMAYDLARGVVVMFGGTGLNGTVLGDTWEWDGVDWRLRSPANTPAARWGHGMAFDSASGRALLCGGWTQTGYVGDLWSWDGTIWTALSTAGIPARASHGMTFDDQRGVLVVHGGRDPAYNWLGDLWEWDGSAWTQRLAAGPSARGGHALVYDPVLAAAVLFGGQDARGATSDTWTWDGSLWTDLGTASPHGRLFSAMALDATGSKTMLFGGLPMGLQNDTWEWDGDRWQERLPTTRPPARYHHALAHDATRWRTVLFGGGAGQGVELADTWEWDGVDWQAMSPAVSPGVRVMHAMAGDSRRGRVVLMGGIRSWTTVLGDVWEWDGAAWVWRVGGPGARFAHGMAYDSARGVTVVFGGRAGIRDLDDTWEWDGTSWRLRRPATSPAPRTQFVMVYDEARARTVLYGGMTYDGTTAFDDVWEWDGVDWRLRTNTMPPGARVAAAAAYDPIRRRTLLNGGYVRSVGTILAASTSMLTWHYGAVSPADLEPYGTGCAGAAGTPSLSGTGLPWLGDPIRLALTSLPSSGAAAFLLGRSSTTWLGARLPLDLGAIGMPGCALLASPDVAVPMPISGGQASLALNVPAAPVLVGGAFFAQGLAADPSANPVGVTVSNGIAGTVGAR